MSFELQYVFGQGQEKIFQLDSSSPVTIGRLASNQIVLPDTSISPIHALIEDSGEGWLVTDLASELGVQVNSQKIHVEAKLNLGDRVQIGPFVLVFQKQHVLPPPPGPSLYARSPEQAPGQVPAHASSPLHASPPAPSLHAPPPVAPPLHAPKDALKKSGPVPQAILKADERRAQQSLLFTPRSAKAAGGVLEVVAYWGNSILNVEHFHPALKGFENVLIGEPHSAHFISAAPDMKKPQILAHAQVDGYELILGEGMSARLRTKGNVTEVGPGTYQLERRDIAHVRDGNIRYFFLFMRPPSVSLPPQGVRDPFMLGLILFALSFYTILCTALFLSEPQPKPKTVDDLWAVVHLPEMPKPISKPAITVSPSSAAPLPPPPPEAKPDTPQPKSDQPKPVENLTQAKTQPEVKKATPPPPKTAGNNKTGGEKKGLDTKSTPGVPEETPQPKAVGLNLGKLGVGVGQVKSFTGVGAIHTNFKNSAGGEGAGSGSGLKTVGLGGLGASESLGLSGDAQVAEKFGVDQGVAGSAGLSNSFGSTRGSTQVSVRAGDPIVAGGLTQDEILEVIRANINQIRHCYERLLQSSPSATGKIKTKFVINLAGEVQSAAIEETNMKNQAMEDCVVNAIRRWKFPTPRGSSPVNVSYPFSFNPL